MGLVQSFRIENVVSFCVFVSVCEDSHPVHLKSESFPLFFTEEAFWMRSETFSTLQERVQLPKLNSSALFSSVFIHHTPGLPKSEGSLQTPLLTLGGSSSVEASTSKQPLYGASGSRDDIFSLGGLSYVMSSKSCGSRSLGCVSPSHCHLVPISFLISLFLFSFPAIHKHIALQGCHVGQRDRKLRNLPPDPAGGTFCATPVY